MFRSVFSNFTAHAHQAAASCENAGADSVGEVEPGALCHPGDASVGLDNTIHLYFPKGKMPSSGMDSAAYPLTQQLSFSPLRDSGNFSTISIHK